MAACIRDGCHFFGVALKNGVRYSNARLTLQLRGVCELKPECDAARRSHFVLVAIQIELWRQVSTS